MNEKVLRHKEICDGLNELYARKNHDYGDSFHTTFVEEGLAMARIRLGDKFSRFKTLSRLSCNDRDQQQVTDESIRDTLLDLANYAIMTVLEMDTPDESHATLYAYDKPKAISCFSLASGVRAARDLGTFSDNLAAFAILATSSRCV